MKIAPHNHKRPTPGITALAVESMELSGDWEAVAAVCAVSRERLDQWLKEGSMDDAPSDVGQFHASVMAARARFTLARLQVLRELIAEEPKLVLRLMDQETKRASGGRGRPAKPPAEHDVAEGDQMVMDMLRQIAGAVGGGED